MRQQRRMRRSLQRLQRMRHCGSFRVDKTVEERQVIDMGNSSGSMLYLVLIIIVVYIVGMSLYTLVQWIKKKKAQKADEEFQRSDK